MPNSTEIQHDIQQYIAQYVPIPDIILLKKSTTSTNDDVLQLYQQQPTLNSVLICSEQQTQGRGQHQRQWLSPQGHIYLSCLAYLDQPLDGRFALEVALNIINSPSLCDYPLQIKWANDLYSTQGKWGGILIEPISPQCVIVGVGVNVATLSAQQRVTIHQPCTSLQELNIHIPRQQLIAELYVAIQTAVQWFNYGSYHLAQRFNHVAYLIHEMIDFEYQQHILHGKFLGIDQQGALILEYLDTQTQLLTTQHFYNGRIVKNYT